MKNIHIGLSICKTLIIIIILSAFIYLGFQFILKPENYISIICPSRDFVQISGYMGVFIFFVFLILIIANLIFNKNRGITINEKGIYVNINIFKQNIIEWENIKSIERIEYYNQNLIIIYLKNNDFFLDKINNRISLFMYKYSLKILGSPITFTSGALKIRDNDKLEQILQDSFKKYKDNLKEIRN